MTRWVKASTLLREKRPDLMTAAKGKEKNSEGSGVSEIPDC